MSNSLDSCNTMMLYGMIETVLFITELLLSNNAYAGRFGAAVQEDFDETLTTAISYGVVTSRSAEFAGITVNYA